MRSKQLLAIAFAMVIGVIMIRLSNTKKKIIIISERLVCASGGHRV